MGQQGNTQRHRVLLSSNLSSSGCFILLLSRWLCPWHLTLTLTVTAGTSNFRFCAWNYPRSPHLLPSCPNSIRVVVFFSCWVGIFRGRQGGKRRGWGLLHVKMCLCAGGRWRRHLAWGLRDERYVGQELRVGKSVIYYVVCVKYRRYSKRCVGCRPRQKCHCSSASVCNDASFFLRLGSAM